MGEVRTLEGEVLAFVAGKHGLINRCRLATPEGALTVKFPKEWSYRLTRTIAPGDRVQVRGKLKIDDDGDYYLKATVILHLKAAALAGAQSLPPTLPELEPVQPQSGPASPTTRVLVCKSSDCCKRGARQLIAQLKETVERYELQDKVTVETTGCMKRCKQGPNLVIMPSKARHTCVDPAEASEILLRELLPKLE
ncbi:(2Fe-2S) ferredoxin domain-containing protein [Gloeobacter kilaueensis]|uniref:Ferredoxin n=1 Tax=Gloeobacter kilaueensis (strain ATCC BAA-2537 / CCAP 1431/1 / ULC 316 / JS1) TaxID=1183438 RepID=U5QIH5_GLOK1|nr:OB-fold nucleic acid binding domain-containing protein [Gloeobacter kilaueensis]AGY58688.1 ferredoxin [Gloeobacter kilaueensis JS1]